MIEFKLSKEELAGEIYRAINEIYPELIFSNELIYNAINDSIKGSWFKFSAVKFANDNNLDSQEFIDRLYKCLGIEFEKNLHDKFLFEMSRDNDNILFKMIGQV